MSFAFIGLLAAAAAAGVLLLNMNLRSPWPWGAKAAATVVTCGLLIVVYLAHLELLGWPAAAKLPERFLLISAAVREPGKAGGDAGAIYIWARPVEDPAAEPRAYRLDYSRELHERVVAALASARDGTRQMGTVTGRGGAGAEEERPVSVRFEALGGRALPPKRRR